MEIKNIKCVLKSDHDCYVQALWGVPISDLFELLYGDWHSVINAVMSCIPAQRFDSKCACYNHPFILPAQEERCISFRPHLDINQDTLYQQVTCLRTAYPFVILMVLCKREEIPESSVIAMASAIHIPDNTLSLPPQLIGQFIKLASGCIGQIKKIFLSSPPTSDDDEDSHDLCIVCYHRPVSVVILPCRHACLCTKCFTKCEKCPICRVISLYYFELPSVHCEHESDDECETEYECADGERWVEEND